MTRCVAIVLYEDSLRKHEFEPHRFVCTCVLDRTGQNLGHLTIALQSRPMNGVDAVIQAVRRGNEIATRGESLIALVDEDRVRRHLKLSAKKSGEEVEQHLGELCPQEVRFRAFVLERNLESLLRAVAECFKAHESIRASATAALNKDRFERDKAFKSAAKSVFSRERQCVTERLPSFGRFVQHLAELCNALDEHSSDG